MCCERRNGAPFFLQRIDMNLYVTEQGARICKRGGHLLVCKGDSVLEDSLLESVESLVLFGTAQPSVDVMMSLMENGSEISFLSRGGHFKGRMVPGVCKNVPLRIKQYDAFRDPEISFRIAKGCIERKLAGGLLLLDSYHRNVHNDFCFEERADYLLNMERLRAYEGPEKESLRGYEGFGAKLYFQAFARCLKHGVAFPGRVYYPSVDPVNALLSFGYSFVARSLESLLEVAGIDPAVGFLHELSYGRSSLALDLLEEFRHPFVDKLVLSLFNKRHIVPEDFETRDDESRPGQLYLKPDAVKVFIRGYEDLCESPNRVFADYKDLTWRDVFRKRVENLKRSLVDGAIDASADWKLLMEECA